MHPRVYEMVWSAVWAETNNRSVGSFNRALWYGKKYPILGQSQGVTGAIRKLPGAAAGAAAGAAGGALAATAPVAIPVAAVAFAALGSRLGQSAVELIHKDIEKASETLGETLGEKIPEIVKEFSTSHVKGEPPPDSAEGLSRNVKREVKELKENAIQVIDRNLVKLKNAKNKVKPAFQAMIDAQPRLNGVPAAINIDLDKPNATEDAILAKAQAAMRAVAETQYYIRKVILQVKAAQWTLERIRTELVNLNAMADQSSSDLAEYIKAAL